jgi:pilus assembly protein CpaB
LGFGASVLIGTQGQAGAGAPTRQVVVAARDLGARTTLKKEDVRLATYVTSDAPPFAYSQTADVVGKVVVVDLRRGQPLVANLLGTSTDVAGSQQAFLPLPKGYVAATVPTGELVGVAGYIEPGDYINVIAVVPSRNGGFSNVRTIYSGIHVIRTGEVAAAGAGQPTSLTLAMSECQAEFINWFVANASLKYSLLSSTDYAAASQAGPDTSCPADGSTGVTETDIKRGWPGLVA